MKEVAERQARLSLVFILRKSESGERHRQRSDHLLDTSPAVLDRIVQEGW